METKTVTTIFGILLLVALTACAKPILKEVPSEAAESAPLAGTVKENPRAVASLQLTDQGRRLLEVRQPDKAIRILEQAVSLNPLNGQNYFYLSEAWLMKGAIDQAKEFNQLAEIHLKDDSEWKMRVAQQAERIAEFNK
jgi:tetratricopeptide (TPR) repeat protein